MSSVSLQKVVKKFGDNEVVRGIELDIKHNEFVVLVGPSGCGKSTILRMIAGLEDVTSGQISIDDRVINELAPKDRDIAMVFQDYALYPHLNVFRNMSFGLEMQKVPAAEIKERVHEAAMILNIQDLLDRKPKQLSGGQRQRVAMGRAIVRKPNVFLFDEPLSNLDAKLRTQMRTEIKKLHQKVKTTIIYVTHDQVEAMTLAERIVVLNEGSIQQIGIPEEVYNRPNSTFVAGFIGAPTMNFIPCRLISIRDKQFALQLPGEVVMGLPEDRYDQLLPFNDKEVILGIRPEFFALVDHQPFKETDARFKVRINVIEPLGSGTLFYFEIGTREVVASLPPMSGLHPGDELELTIDTSKILLFDNTTAKLI